MCDYGFFLFFFFARLESPANLATIRGAPTAAVLLGQTSYSSYYLEKNICGEDVMILIIITIRSDKVFHLKSHCRTIQKKTPDIQFHVMELATGAGAETSASFAQHFDQRGCLTKHFLELGLIPCFVSKLHDDLLIS
jgi:hypothetical protein